MFKALALSHMLAGSGVAECYVGISLNSLRGGYIRDYIGDYYRGY